MNPNRGSLTPAERTRLWLRRGAWAAGILIVSSAYISFKVNGYVSEKGGQEIFLAKAQIRVIGLMLTAHKAVYNHYPTQEEGLEKLNPEPKTPAERELIAQRLKDPWQRRLRYIIPGVHNPDSYDLYSLGSDGIEETEDDITNW
jgi:type II secretion system protein G